MEGFDSLYKNHFNEIARFMDRFTGNRLISEEMTQEAFYRVLKKSPVITRSFVAYMKATALNFFRNQRRQFGNMKQIEDNDWIYENHIINDIFMKEQADLLLEAVAKLPPRQQETMILFLSGHTINEIAAELKQPYDTVKANIRHVTEKLKLRKKFFKDAFGPEDLTEKRLGF